MTAPPKIPVSVVVPVKNEAAQIGACLERLRDFAEIIVVDSASEDGTAQIARRHGARVLQFRWDGRFPKKRNWTLETHAFAADWVLFLDADERVDARFRAAVARAVRSDRFAGYWLSYRNRFLGRPLRFGAPQRKLALFRRDAGRYERIDEAAWTPLDMEVHEHPQIAGRVGRLRAPIEHCGAHSLDALETRHAHYAVWEAQRVTALTPAASARLTLRQRLKYRFIRQPWFAYAYFLFHYVLRLGVLDGRPGLGYALLKLRYFRRIARLCRQGAQADPAKTATLPKPNTT